ncbi:oligosaccharide flippase family protein [Gordonia rubripertincta]|nr:oligosaccharide flippase family protein [Gordonia rubripertincta]
MPIVPKLSGSSTVEVSGALRRVVLSAGARIFVLPLSGVAAILLARIVSTDSGEDGYAIFTLVAALPFLIPFTDLGLGAAVTNSAAGLPANYVSFRRVLRSVTRMLVCVSATLLCVNLVIYLSITWPALLNLDPRLDLNLAIFVAMTVFCASAPLALGFRILLGIRHNAAVVVVQGFTSVFTLILVGIAVSLSDDSLKYAVGLSTSGVFIANGVLSVVAWRKVVGQAALARRHVTPLGFQVADERLLMTAVPMFIISLALPLVFQTDRLILSWFSSLTEVAQYSAAALVFLPAVSVVQMGGRSLWGDFAAARHRGSSSRSLYGKALRLSIFMGVVVAGGFCLVAPAITRFAVPSASREISLYLAFALLLFVQAVQQPAGMFLTDGVGLRFQAITTSISAVIGLPVSVALAGEYGAVGVVAGTAGVAALLHVVPCLMFSRLRLNKEHHASAETERRRKEVV